MRKLRYSEEGYTLMVIAALFLAFSVVVASMLDTNVVTTELDRKNNTHEQLSDLAEALAGYAADNSDDYPCPAATNLDMSNASFGTQVANCHIGAPAGMEVLADGETLRGMVPVRTLVPYGTDLEDAFDAWGNRVMYVISKERTPGGTGVATITITLSNITTGDQIINPKFVLISYGRDKMGGIHKGALAAITNCAASTTPRLENCDTDSTFAFGPSYTAAGATTDNYFDDIVAYHTGDFAGRPYCWGEGSNGQLGDGASTDRDEPTLIPNTTFSAIYASTVHSCALNASGVAYCWGDNTNGKLGDNTTTNRPSPTAVNLSYTYKQLALGASHTCGLHTNGNTYCWGLNTDGQLGDASLLQRESPTLVSGSHIFTEITAGTAHTCGRKNDGSVWCWGDNTGGALGTGAAGADQNTPQAVAGGHLFAHIAAKAAHTCAVKSDGSAYCWGQNNVNQVDSTAVNPRATPTAIAGTDFETAMGGGYFHSCGLKTTGLAYCWGQNAGILGDGTAANRNSPTQVVGSDWSMIATHGVSCGIKEGGLAYCWGTTNASGQIGNNTTGAGAVTSPTAVYGGYRFNYLAAGTQHACGIASSSGGGSGGPPADCALPWGGTLTHGDDVDAWNLSSSCGACASQNRACDNGTLSGTYANQTCDNDDCGKGSGAGGGCFLGHVKVRMADGSLKPISELKVGDKVKGQTRINSVVRTKLYTNYDIVYAINDRHAFVTPEHEFLAADGWSAIDPELTYEETKGHSYPNKLEVGDVLLTETGQITVESIVPITMRPRTVYNPELDGDHTYYANGYLVHNMQQK